MSVARLRLAGLSLRARLLLAVISLAAVGLVVANVVTYTSLRSFLVDRADAALQDSARSLRAAAAARPRAARHRRASFARPTARR